MAHMLAVVAGRGPGAAVPTAKAKSVLWRSRVSPEREADAFRVLLTGRDEPIDNDDHDDHDYDDDDDALPRRYDGQEK